MVFTMRYRLRDPGLLRRFPGISPWVTGRWGDHIFAGLQVAEEEIGIGQEVAGQADVFRLVPRDR